MKKYFLLLYCVLILISSNAQPLILLKVKKIYDQSPHAAFTDLTVFKNFLYCVFREGTGHVPGKTGSDGTIRVLRSKNGKTWDNVAFIKSQGIDLRDPKITVTPQGLLMINMGGSVYAQGELKSVSSMVSFSNDGKIFSTPQKINIDPSIATSRDWLWRVTWHEQKAFGKVYQFDSGKTGFHLVASDNGLSYTLIKTFDLTGSPNETTIRFDGTKMLALVRREKENKLGNIGMAEFPYTQWTWQELPIRIGGPNFLKVGDEFLMATRKYGDETKTVIGKISSSGQWAELFVLPSGKDTSYPGMAIFKNKLFVSYYSGHEEKTSIYLASFKGL